MNCEKCELKIMQYLDDQKQGISKEIQIHLDECPSCKEQFEQLSAVLSSLEIKEVPTPSANFEQEVMLKVNTYVASKEESKFSILAISICILAILSMPMLAIALSFSNLNVLQMIFAVISFINNFESIWMLISVTTSSSKLILTSFNILTLQAILAVGTFLFSYTLVSKKQFLNPIKNQILIKGEKI